MHRWSGTGRWRWLLLALCCAHAAAQGVHKCVAHDGAVSYQSMACEAPSREAANWDAPPDPPVALRQRVAESASGRTRPVERTARAGRTHIARAPQPSACEAARANRERTLERVGLKRNFDLLSRLDEQVRSACR